jgi:DNA-binding PadR family transcriptional regulator
MIGYPGTGKIVVGGRGFLRAHLTVYGRADHSAARCPTVSAISRATRLVNEIETSAPTVSAEEFGLPPKITVTSIRGGAPGTWSVVPDRCEIEVDVRLTPNYTADQAWQTLRTATADLDTADPGMSLARRVGSRGRSGVALSRGTDFLAVSLRDRDLALDYVVEYVASGVQSSVMRMTMPLEAVLRALLEEPTEAWYGLQICERAGLPSGTIYPMLRRLVQAGWLKSFWEDQDVASAEGRPARRYYRFSDDGAEQARHALAVADAARRARLSRRHLTPGVPEEGRA